MYISDFRSNCFCSFLEEFKKDDSFSETFNKTVLPLSNLMMS